MNLIRSKPALLLLLWLLSATGPIPALAQSGTGQFLLISDIHFDPFYDGSLFNRLVASPAEDWAGIFEESHPIGFNPRGKDSNYALLKNSLDEAKTRIPDPDFVLYPGDLMAHQWQAKYDGLAKESHLADPEGYRAFTAKAIRFLANEFRRRYPKTPILPTLGNDDSYCGDYMITPDGPFLEMFAKAWETLLGPERDGSDFAATFPRGGYFSMRLPRMKDHRLVVLNSVVFAVHYDDTCGTSTQTPALDQLRWFDRTLERAHEAGESVWLLMHIPPGINSFNSSESVGGGGPPVTFWQPELTGRFLQLVRRYRSTVRAAFVGHTHMDDFRVVRQEGEPVLFLKIAPAISPIFGNNPGYQVYQYDRESGNLHNYQTHYLTNLTSEGKPTIPQAGRWAREYDFNETYGLPALDPRTVARLADAVGTDEAVRESYMRFYGVSGPPEITGKTLDVYRCAIANVTPSEFLTCYRGEPKPRRPPRFPDRRRTVESSTSP